MNSPHEAAAVIREEFDEYWDEVKKHNTSKPDRDTRPRQREELIQLAAMCIRAITDTIDIKPVKYAVIYNAPGFGASTQAAIDAAQESLREIRVMKYTFTNKNMTIEEANLLLRVLWGTCDDDSIHPDYREAFTKDRIDLYRHLGKDAVINLGVEFVQ